MTLINKQVVLWKRPQGEPKPSDFGIVENAVPDLKDGEVLLKTLYFSLDPYMRGRMNVSRSYVPPFNLGETLDGAAVCSIEASKSPNLKVGDHVLSTTGWQSYAVIKPIIKETVAHEPNLVTKLPSDVKPSLFLGILGMPGFTAYYGLYDIGEPKKAETVVVSSAAGAVGSLVGQLAKQKGCYVVGIAGGTHKCKHVVEDLCFDACVDYHSKTFASDLKKACPKGIDVYFENVGGSVFYTVLPLLNVFARVPVCGAIAWYNDGKALAEPGYSPSQIIAKSRALWHFLRIDQTPLLLGSMITKRLKFQGFINSDHAEKYGKFVKEILPLVKSDQIKYKEDITKGIEKAPEAFCGLLQGKNFGKAVIEV